MHIRTSAILCAVKAHGEHGAVVRVLTRDHGLLAGYVQGARGRDYRPILIPANQAMVELRARTEAQLPSLRCELTHSVGPLLGEPLAAAALQWITALAAIALPESHPYSSLYDALLGVIGAIEAAPAARGWASSIVRYEMLLLSMLGFGLDLSTCVVTGAGEDLRYVSPKTGRAVSGAAGEVYAARLLALPPFLRDGGQGDWSDILNGLTLSGHFLDKHILQDNRATVGEVRLRLVDRLKKAAD
jgi:DNA repair protein RecO (recombination protein O)